MINNILLAKHGQDLALSASIVALHGLSPNISQVAIATTRPLRGSLILNVQTCVEGHAVSRGLGPVDWGFALVSNGRRDGLTRQEHGMHIGIASGEDSVGNEGEEHRHQGGRVGIPLADKAGDGLVEGVDETHGRLRIRSLVFSCPKGGVST